MPIEEIASAIEGMTDIMSEATARKVADRIRSAFPSPPAGGADMREALAFLTECYAILITIAPDNDWSRLEAFLGRAALPVSAVPVDGGGGSLRRGDEIRNAALREAAEVCSARSKHHQRTKFGEPGHRGTWAVWAVEADACANAIRSLSKECTPVRQGEGD
jgi:hypothetical protein